VADQLPVAAHRALCRRAAAPTPVPQTTKLCVCRVADHIYDPTGQHILITSLYLQQSGIFYSSKKIL